MSTLATIHIAKKELGLDDETYRDFLARETGKRSAKDLTEAERRKVVLAFEQQGFKRSSKGGSKPRADRLSGPYAAKLQALWIAAWNLGIVENASDAALIAFVKRQTGISHGRWLRHGDDATKVIEALKDWMRRESGNEGLYRRERSLPPLMNDHRFQILVTIWMRLARLDAAPAASLDAWVARMQPGSAYADFSKDAWIDLMNVLGAKLRAALRKV
ncbi:gp16 family protein [Stappia sp. ES.058]|uniref:gp16 family protein n=1 Tax=Stappia sp. ES.058 TaxID=1881061 RepID=UPI00087C4DD4|nr:regulatory protein GemA [Stappia sp. ES.058]SDU08973.1 Mu-like prophage protein gp16 [Stappia sp. ES.058]